MITLPLFFKAAKAALVEYTATTPEDKLELTELESPPVLPHVITLPLLFKAANEFCNEYGV